MSGSYAFLSKTVAVAAIAAVIGTTFFAVSPVQAQEVTGYETGYEYRQGLAIGAGGRLMAAQYGESASPSQQGVVLGNTTQPIAQNAIFVPTPQVAPQAAAAPAPVQSNNTLFSAPVVAAGIVGVLSLLALASWVLSRREEEEYFSDHAIAYR